MVGRYGIAVLCGVVRLAEGGEGGGWMAWHSLIIHWRGFGINSCTLGSTITECRSHSESYHYLYIILQRMHEGNKGDSQSTATDGTVLVQDLLQKCHSLLSELEQFRTFLAERQKEHSIEIRQFHGSVQSELRSLVKVYFIHLLPKFSL